jgi:hypothetical protein
MRLYILIFSFFLIISLSCNRWEYDDLSIQVESVSPETHLSLVALDTIWVAPQIDQNGDTTLFYIINYFDSSFVIIDSMWIIDSTNQDNSYWVYDTSNFMWWGTDLSGENHGFETISLFDTSAFHTITTSKQELNWWGDDPDGDIVGYYYRWNTDSDWIYTEKEGGIFYVPIRKELDVFSFEIKAVDNEGNEDNTPAKLVMPIQNSSPQILFRYLSNPQISDIGDDTSFTFPTRTFVWDLYDQDGNETITDIFYTLNDTCDTCWARLAGDIKSITLTNLDPGINSIYIKCKDIAGAESDMIQFPDSTRPDDAQVWWVKPLIGDVLIVDDFPLDGSNNTLAWYSSMMDTLVGEDGYSIWEIGDELPYSSTDVIANLNYFKHVVWFAAYNNTASANDTYNAAEASLINFIMSGGNLFINPIDFEDTTFTWFPLDSIITINPNGRLRSGRKVESAIDSTLDLEVSSLIAVKVKGFWPDESEFETVTEIYHMADPQSGDGWVGNPTVCSIGQYRVSPTKLSGKVVLMTLPLYDGNRAKLNGNGSSIKLFQYLFDEEFIE